MTQEKELQAWVLEAAITTGWLGYHTHDSRRSESGFPDLVLARERTMFRELKISSAPSVVTAEQRVWLHRLRAAGQDADVWTLADWPTRIMQELRSTAPRLPRDLPPLLPPKLPRTRKPPSPEAVRAALAARGRGLVPPAR